MDCFFKEIVMSNNYSDMIYNNTTEKEKTVQFLVELVPNFKKKSSPRWTIAPALQSVAIEFTDIAVSQLWLGLVSSA